MKFVILGTAGHIDHGKSALVRALTGIDPDRLKEEKQRGITIDLGFAYLKYDDGITVGIVDVPGHERLVRNMLAGAGGIDIVLFVVAADEAVMPQTKEHLAICNLLGIKDGIIALTKADLVDEEWLELVKEEIRSLVKGTFLENATIIPVSSKTGLNLQLLKEKIHYLAKKIQPKSHEGPFRLPVDRVFTLHGFGTIVTGTAITGTVKIDMPLEIQPLSKKTKVRGIQTHGVPVKEGFAGQRLAINLQGVEKDEIQRGDILISEGYFVPTTSIEVFIEWLPGAPELNSGTPVHFHLFTKEAIAKLILYEKDKIRSSEQAYAQLRLDRPVIASVGDRFVLRRFSPVETIGGGVILDPYPKKRKRKESIEDLKQLHNGNIKDKINTKLLKAGLSGINEKLLQGWISSIEPSGKTIEKLKEENVIIKYSDKLVHKKVFQSIEHKIVEALERFHKNNPLKPGIEKETLRSFFKIPTDAYHMIIELSDNIIQDKEFLKLKGFKVTISETFEKQKEKIVTLLKEKGFQPPSREEIAQILKVSPKEIDDILRLISQEGSIVRINDTYYLHKDHYNNMIKAVWRHFQKEQSLTVGQFRDMLGTSRKYALPFLEHLDSRGITMRVQDIRKKHPSFKGPIQ